jgi:hypothetical protein
MGCYRHQPASCAHMHRIRHSLRHRTGALLCLLALFLSLVAPVVHMWEVGAEQQAAVLRLFSALSRLHSAEHAAVFTAPERVARSLPHDTTLCSICQGLSRLRAWQLTRVYVVVAPDANRWQAPQTASCSAVSSLYTHTPRAPPVLS